jgi:hypothetical protein
MTTSRPGYRPFKPSESIICSPQQDFKSRKAWLSLVELQGGLLPVLQVPRQTTFEKSPAFAFSHAKPFSFRALRNVSSNDSTNVNPPSNKRRPTAATLHSRQPSPAAADKGDGPAASAKVAASVPRATWVVGKVRGLELGRDRRLWEEEYQKSSRGPDRPGRRNDYERENRRRDSTAKE